MKRKLMALLKFALPYILTALIPLVSVFCFSTATVEEYHSRLLKDRQESMGSAFNRFCSRIQNMETNVNQLARNDITAQYSYASILGKGHTAFDNYEFQNLLQDYWLNADAATVFCYDATNNTVVSPGVSLSNALDYFKYVYKIQGLEPQQHISRLKNLTAIAGYSPAMQVTVDNAALEIVEYRFPLPVGVTSTRGCQLVVALRADRVFADVLDVMEPEGEFYFYNEKGTLIYGSGDSYRLLADSLSFMGYLPLEASGVDAMMFSSADGKWKLKVVVPQAPRGNIPAYVGVLVALSLVASTVLTAYFTVKNFRQLQEVLQIFTGKKTEIPESNYRQIKQYAAQIVSDNSRYREEMARYAGSRRYHLMDMLLRGTYENEETLLADMRSEGIRIPEGSKAVLCVQYGQGGRQQQALIRETLAELGYSQAAVFQTALGESVCILPLEDGQIREAVCALEESLSRGLEAEVQAAAGAAVSALRQLSLAYAQAKTVLRYRDITRSPVHLYGEVSDLQNDYYFPDSFGERVQNLILADQKEEARELIASIYERNFGQGRPLLSFRAIERLRAELKDLLLSMADRYDIPVEDNILQAESSGNVVAFFEMARICVDKLIEQMGERNRSSAQVLAGRIRDYIDRNYCDSALSVNQISGCLNIHENYVSRLFKAEYGENLSVYIERKRIDTACQLLRSTNLRIAEIAERVGYSSDLSFRRVFKKLKDVSPATYRNNNA